MLELPEDNPLRSRYVAVQRVYETIPGPAITGKRLDPRGDIETVEVQTVVAGTAPTADGLLVTETKVDPVDSVKSTKTTATVQSYAQLTAKSNKSGLLGNTSTTDNIVAPATNPDALSTTILESTVEQLTATKARKRTTTASGPTELDGKTIGEFGLITTGESIVAYGSALPTPSKSTVKLEKSPIDIAKSKLVDASYDSLNTLTGYQYDADLGLIITNTKEIVSPNTALSYATGLISSRDEPVDVWKTIRIQSKITSLPEQREEYKTGSYSSPNLLTGLSQYVFNFPDGQIQLNVTPVMRAERSFQTVFKYVTSYQYNQPNDPSPTLFDPLAIHVVYKGFFFSIDIPNCLTDEGLYVEFYTGVNTAAAAYYGVIDERYIVPTTTTSAGNYNGLIGSYQLISYEIDYWKANIWRKVDTYVLLK
jgi:hypothetical protein